MILFRKCIVNIILARFINNQTKSATTLENNFICMDEKIRPNFDGIQFAFHKNEVLSITYTKEPIITVENQFFINNIKTVNYPQEIKYSNETIKLLVFHGIPLTSMLHQFIFHLDVEFRVLVYFYFKDRATHGLDFLEEVRCAEQHIFPLKSVIYKNRFVYPAVYKFIKKCTSEPITFAEEDRHFGFIHSGGYTSKQMEYSLNQLGLRVRRIQKPGEEYWVCTQLINNVYSNRTFHFTIKEQIDYPIDWSHLPRYSAFVKGKNQV